VARFRGNHFDLDVPVGAAEQRELSNGDMVESKVWPSKEWIVCAAAGGGLLKWKKMG
jgi:hypothetical protein